MKPSRQDIRPRTATTAQTYLDIAKWMRSKIETGELPPGDRIPSAQELMRVFEVSERTARRALKELKEEGLTIAEPGRRTVACEVRPVERLAFGESMVGETFWPPDVHRKPRACPWYEFKLMAPLDVANALQIPPGSPLRVRDRSYITLPRRQIRLVTSYRPTYVPGRPEPVSVSFRDELRARMPTQGERDAMELSIVSPVLEIGRTSFTDDGRPAELIHTILDTNAYILEYGHVLSEQPRRARV